MITIFTPTYNRAKLLDRVYQSLKNQTNLEFEWLIVDDGSNDDTKSVVDGFIAKGILNIRYLYKENGGVSSAMNYGIAHTENEIFFRVDSDDFLKEDAIAQIYAHWSSVRNDDKMSGLVFLTETTDGKLFGTHPFKDKFKTNYFEYRFVHGAVGDRAEVTKTAVLKQFPFPLFEGEKFCPEGVMWNRIAQQYDALYIPIAIHVREMDMQDSITSKVTATLEKNSMGTTTYYGELLNMKPISFISFMKNSLLYWRYALVNKKEGFIEKFKRVPLKSNLCLFPAIALLLLDRITRNRRFK